ncbi:helix-turn-helix transcriptional regulator [Methanosarcina barkeri]|uniref:ArsR/SmtB family transcription factor n=1 Tax=Methanosarcina barkeri TaxID=2208 RepID=UPI00064E7178|nr:MarR family transcriptional regulator [Methanosarcina barkeri]
MDKKSDLDPSQEFLISSSGDIVSILKTIAHINRFTILVLLLNGPSTFQMLLERMDIKKSALANHLAELKDSNLVEKTHHGTYEISENGKNYIKSIEKIYRENKVIEQKIWEAKQREQLSKSFLKRKQ